MRHLPAIDGLRAVAVLAVVAYHAGLPIRAGYAGVDVFFVISGFVITRMLRSEQTSTGRIDLLAFYARRVRRLLPALLVVVGVTLILSAAMLSADLQSATNRSAIAAMVMLANVHFAGLVGGYFSPSAEHMPLLHLWSLAVEEQFYLLWPLLLMFRQRWLLVALAIGSIALAQFWMVDHREAAFYLMPSRFWELAAGGLVAMAPTISRQLGPVIAMAGAGFLYIALSVSDPNFPALGALPVVFGTALVLYAVHCGSRVMPLEWGPVRYVGLVSYSFYLWHWPLLALAKGTTYDEPTLATNLLLCAAAFVLASISYHFVEQPFRQGTARTKAIAAGVAACLVLAGCSGAMEAALRNRDDLSTRTALDEPREAECQGVDEACAADVVLWGDSHAKAWQPLAEQYGVVHQLTWPGCIASTLSGRSQGKACDAFNRKSAPIAKRAPLVILGGFWLERLENGGNGRWDFESALKLLHGQRVIVIGPVPELPGIPQRCIQTKDFDRCTRLRADFDRRAQPVRDYMLAIIRQHPNVEYVEPADFFCDATTCPMMRDGYSLYWDDDHISYTAAREFAKLRARTAAAPQASIPSG